MDHTQRYLTEHVRSGLPKIMKKKIMMMKKKMMMIMIMIMMMIRAALAETGSVRVD